MPESAPWLSDFIDEMAAFPNGAYDDSFDSTTQALNYFRQQGTDCSTWEVFAKVNAPRRLIRDKEELWRRAMLGYPMTEAEIDRM